jgi:hypothetical protein
MNSHLFAERSVVIDTCSTIFESIKSHTPRTRLQSIREWCQLSSWPHIGKAAFYAICLLSLTSLVGKEWCASHLRKIRTLDEPWFSRASAKLPHPQTHTMVSFVHQASLADSHCQIQSPITRADWKKLPFTQSDMAKNHCLRWLNGIFWITSISADRKFSAKFCRFHAAIGWLIIIIVFHDAIGRSRVSLGKPVHIPCICCTPSPILLIKPICSTSRPSSIDHHTWEGWLPNSATSNLLFGK